MLSPVAKTAVKSIEKESRSTEQMLEAKPLRKNQGRNYYEPQTKYCKPNHHFLVPRHTAVLHILTPTQSLHEKREKVAKQITNTTTTSNMSSDFHYSRCYLFPSYSLHGCILPIN